MRRDTDGPVRLAYLASHPIQYQAPMLRRIAADAAFALKVFFCSEISVHAYHDPGFGKTIAWDTPLLEGYDYTFLPAFDDRRRLTVWRPINYGFARELRRGQFDLLWVNAYARWAHLVAIANAKRLGVKVLLRDEPTPISSRRGPVKRAVKAVFWAVLRQFCDGVCAIGKHNRDYFLGHGFPPDRIFSLPYGVDNDHFRAGAERAAPERETLRAELGLAPGRPIILFAGKLFARKRPLDVLEAHARLTEMVEARKPYLLFLGDGVDRAALERRATELGTGAVRFLGFRNQSELPRFYDLCDVFVMASEYEPWGLVVNEAMNAGRAVVISDEVGCAPDLVHDGENGFTYRKGDIAALTDALRRVLADPDTCRRMGQRSLAIVAEHSIEANVAGLKQACTALLGRPMAP